MEIIQHENGGYIKRHNGKPTLVSGVKNATQFNTGDAQRFINFQIKKKNRELYKVIQISEPPEMFKQQQVINARPIVSPHISAHKTSVALAKDISETIHQELDKTEKYLQIRLKKIDDWILDFRHWTRREDTRLNACQQSKAFKELQKMEKERSEVKKELQRCKMVISCGEEMAEKAENFDYDEYKPRSDVDFNKLIKG